MRGRAIAADLERELAGAASPESLVVHEQVIATRLVRRAQPAHDILAVAVSFADTRESIIPGQSVTRTSGSSPSMQSVTVGSGARALDAVEGGPVSRRGTPAAAQEQPARSEERQPRVLIVHENARVLSTVVEVIGAEFEVRTAISGQQALAMIGSAMFDLVIAKEDLSDCSGPTVLKAALSRHPMTTGVLLSTRDRYQDSIRALRAASIVPRVLCEPIEPAELLAKARGVLTLVRMRQATAKLHTRQPGED
jgi:PleD family two-component response regulator